MSSKVTLVAVGDIMLSENRDTGKIIKKHGPDYPFLKIKDYLKQADICFGNLEGPISSRGKSYSNQYQHITFRNNPIIINALKNCQFDILSLANNHMHDYGDIAIYDTLKYLEKHKIQGVGAGTNLDSIRKPVIIKKKNIKIAFLAYSTMIQFQTKQAKKDKIGISLFNEKKALKDVEKAKQKADVVIVSMHWGLDFTEYPLPFQMKSAKHMIDKGANLIIGHHPHTIQGIEKYRNGVIVYSLGDFIFDNPKQNTIICKCRLSKKGVEKFKLITARTSNNLQIELLKFRDSITIKKRIADLSRSYRKYNKSMANQMVNKYIYINLFIFRKSRNLHVLKSFYSPELKLLVLKYIISHLVNKLRKILSR